MTPLQATAGRPAAAYGLSLFALGLAVSLRYALDPWMRDSLPLVTVFAAVAAAVWLGGYRPAALVTLAGYAACSYLFIQPRGYVGPFVGADFIGFVAYALTCALIIAFGEAARLAQARASERREVLRVTLSSIGDAVITTDDAARVTYLNAVAESLTGWLHADAVGQPLDTVFHIVNESTRKPVENPATRALREGIVVGLANHTILIRRDGSECPIDDSAAPIRDDGGVVSGCVLIFRDVSAQRQAEREKAEQLMTARLLASIVESSDDAIISKSLAGIVQSWNAGAERVFGYTAEQAIGRHISLIIPPDRVSEEDHIIAHLQAGRRIEHFETERRRADGERISVSLTISPLKDDDGRVVGASKIVRDITERKRAEADREKLVALVEQSTDFIGMCDLNGVPFFVNRAGLELVGFESLEEAKRTPVTAFFFPEDQDRIANEFFPSVLATGHGEIEVRFRHFKTGAARWMAYKVLTLLDPDGRPTGFATVSQDVTERKRLEDSLRRLADDLSEADRRKNEFLAMLAHELRNPLAPISNAVRALRLSPAGDPATQSAAGMLDRQVSQMSRLVDDLLDMSRITRGKIELRRQRVELRPIVEQAVEAVRVSYRSLQHEFTVTHPSDPIYVDADPARIAQIIGNLLNNAGKFTERGGAIALSVERQGEQVVLTVKDNGIGIAPDELGRVFEMFAQVDTSLERSRDGLGIGLTLVKTLTEMHGGTVTAHSEGRGKGSTFTISLPVIAEQVRVASPPPGVSVPAAATSRRILIVDDNPDGAESLAMLLEFSGHETHKAHDGQEAIAAARRLSPDVVLLDIGLPRMNGYEVCMHLRQTDWGRHLMLIALTGWGQEEDRQRSHAAGFDAHLVKPVDHDLLLELLAAVPRRVVPAIGSPSPTTDH